MQAARFGQPAQPNNSPESLFRLCVASIVGNYLIEITRAFNGFAGNHKHNERSRTVRVRVRVREPCKQITLLDMMFLRCGRNAIHFGRSQSIRFQRTFGGPISCTSSKGTFIGHLMIELIVTCSTNLFMSISLFFGCWSVLSWAYGCVEIVANDTAAEWPNWRNFCEKLRRVR